MDATTRLLGITVAGLLAIVMTVVMLRPPAPETVGRDRAAAAQMYELVDEARAEEGLAPLAPAADVADVAAAWSARMAEAEELTHNPDHPEQICCWIMVSENVAWSQPPRTRLSRDPVAQVVEELHHELLRSTSHRVNLLDPHADEIGIGVHVGDDGDVWITQNFRAAAP